MRSPDTDDVIYRIKHSKEIPEVNWGVPIDDYSELVHTLLFLSMCDIALEWIDENKPQAFYRMLFVESIGEKEP
jgi:hypothetical protein